MSKKTESSCIEEPIYEQEEKGALVTLELGKEKKQNLISILNNIRSKRYIAIVSLLITALGVFLEKNGYLIPKNIFIYLNSHPMVAPIIFIIIFILMTLLLLPTLPLNLGAGYLWGPYLGGFYTITGASIGAAIAFLISRYLAEEFTNRYFRNRTWIWLMQQVQTQDWKVVAFTRINPIFPTALLNYFFGLTPIKFRNYLLTTVLFIAPMALFFSFLGDSVGGYLLGEEASQYLQSFLGASATITLIYILRIGFKKPFKS